jgi:pimeloyl-ACP methyl ester carboxylesterase
MSRIALGRVSLEVWDEGRGVPVLLLHGFPTTRLLWKNVVPLLVRAGCRAIAPDLVGYGQSDAPAELEIDMARQAEWMLGLLDSLGIERALLVAHDVGSAAAQIIAARAPQRAMGLMVIDGVYRDQWALEAVESIRAFEPSAAASLFRLLVRRMRRQWTTTDVPEDLIRQVLAPYEGQEGGARLIRAARALDPQPVVAILEELQHKRVASRVLWGAKDAFLGVDTVARPLADLLGAELKVFPGGHFLPLDCPSEIAAEVQDFLRQLHLLAA